MAAAATHRYLKHFREGRAARFVSIDAQRKAYNGILTVADAIDGSDVHEVEVHRRSPPTLCHTARPIEGLSAGATRSAIEHARSQPATAAAQADFQQALDEANHMLAEVARPLLPATLDQLRQELDEIAAEAPGYFQGGNP
jgi:hypothetical protein